MTSPVGTRKLGTTGNLRSRSPISDERELLLTGLNYSA